MLGKGEREFLRKALNGDQLQGKDYTAKCKLKKKMKRIIDDYGLINQAILKGILPP